MDYPTNIMGVETPAKKLGIELNNPILLDNIQSLKMPPSFNMSNSNQQKYTPFTPNQTNDYDIRIGTNPNSNINYDHLNNVGFLSMTHWRKIKYENENTFVPNKYQLMILYNKPIDTSVNSQLKSLVNDRGLYIARNIVTWNYYQHLSEKMDKYKQSSNIPLATDIMNDWTIEGFVKSEEGENKSNGRADSRRPFRLINSHIRGRGRALNIWGSNIQEGTKLFIILKKVLSDGIYNLSPDIDQKSIVPIASDTNNSRDSCTNRPFQMIPYAHYAHKIPPKKELIYEDEHGNTAYGIYIYIGFSRVNVFTNQNSTENVPSYTNYRILSSQPSIEIISC
jgi:hypothetical protein